MAPNWPKTVRVARQDDEPAIFDLLMALYKDNGLGVAPRAADLRDNIRAGTRNPQSGVIIGIIDGPNGTAKGSVCLVPQSHWFNSAEWFLSERWLFLRPEFRLEHGHVDALFDFMVAYQAMAEESTGQKWPIVTSVSSLKRLDAKMRLWGRRAKLIGGIYVIESGVAAASVPATEAAE